MSRNSSVALSREGTRKNGREKRMSVSSQTTLQKLGLKGKKKIWREQSVEQGGVEVKEIR